METNTDDYQRLEGDRMKRRGTVATIRCDNACRPALLVGLMLGAGLLGGGYAYAASPERSGDMRMALASDILGVVHSNGSPALPGSSIPAQQIVDPKARVLMAGGGGGGNGGDRGGDKPKKKPKKPEKTEKQKKKDWFEEFKDAVREDFGDNRTKKK